MASIGAACGRPNVVTSSCCGGGGLCDVAGFQTEVVRLRYDR